MEVRPLETNHHREAARLITDALLHDPAGLPSAPSGLGTGALSPPVSTARSSR
jgi:hypothetical protein